MNLILPGRDFSMSESTIIRGTPELKDFTGVVIYSDLRQSGFFQCSNPLINRLEENIRWGMKGNFIDIPTDCPQRDERMGVGREIFRCLQEQRHI